MMALLSEDTFSQWHYSMTYRFEFHPFIPMGRWVFFFVAVFFLWQCCHSDIARAEKHRRLLRVASGATSFQTDHGSRALCIVCYHPTAGLHIPEAGGLFVSARLWKILQGGWGSRWSHCLLQLWTPFQHGDVSYHRSHVIATRARCLLVSYVYYKYRQADWSSWTEMKSILSGDRWSLATNNLGKGLEVSMSLGGFVFNGELKKTGTSWGSKFRLRIRFSCRRSGGLGVPELKVVLVPVLNS